MYQWWLYAYVNLINFNLATSFHHKIIYTLPLCPLRFVKKIGIADLKVSRKAAKAQRIRYLKTDVKICLWYA